MFTSILYFKEDSKPHQCNNSVDEAELLKSGWYFRTEEEATKARKPEPVAVAKKEKTKSPK